MRYGGATAGVITRGAPSPSPFVGELTDRSHAREQEALREQLAVEEALARHQCICDICTCGKHHW